MKTNTMIFITMLILVFISGKNLNSDDSDISGPQKIVSRVVKENGPAYIEAGGKPYLFYGIQLRLDDYLEGDLSPGKMKKCEAYFKHARQMNFKTVVIPVPWNYIQPGAGLFDFDAYLLYVLEYARKYDLQVQLMWFGSNVCGWPTCVPGFVAANKKVYPRIEGRFPPFHPFDFSSAALLAAEKKALQKLMDYLYVHDRDNRVIMMQVENEPDAFNVIAPWTPDLTGKNWVGGQKERIITMLDELGSIVHNSKYSIVTRYNAIGPTEKAQQVFNTPGIDIVGRDVYVYRIGSPGEEYSFLQLTRTFDYPGNVNHTPENGAQYENSINLILAAFNERRGYLLYELRTTGDREYDFGLYRKTSLNSDKWQKRDGTKKVHYEFDNSDRKKTEVKGDEVALFNKLIYKADRQIATIPKENTAAFNLANKQKKVDEVKQLGGVTIKYNSKRGSEAFVLMENPGSFIILNMYDKTEFTFSKEITNASAGYFDPDNKWVPEKKVKITDGNQVMLNGCEAVYIHLKN